MHVNLITFKVNNARAGRVNVQDDKLVDLLLIIAESKGGQQADLIWASLAEVIQGKEPDQAGTPAPGVGELAALRQAPADRNRAQAPGPRPQRTRRYEQWVS
jgi:hypothetical protein